MKEKERTEVETKEVETTKVETKEVETTIGKKKVHPGIVAGALILALGVGVFSMSTYQTRQAEAKLLAETPLTETVYWSSMDNFPKYKLEAAKEVKELMAEGINQEEACQQAIESASNKIYEDTMRFIEENPDIEGSEWDSAYGEYVASIQR